MRRNPKAEQELWLAVRSLAWQSKKIKLRLPDAYEYHLSYVDSAFIPKKSMQKKLEKIKNRLTKNHTLPAHEAIYYWPTKSCVSIATDICDLYDELIHFEWHRHPESSLPL